MKVKDKKEQKEGGSGTIVKKRELNSS